MKAKPISLILTAILLILFTGSAFGQVKSYLTARVDTTQREVKAVYELIGNYINSNPDSLYNNPYWNEDEVDYYFR